MSKKNQIFFFKIFFWPRSLTRYPPSTSESFTLMGLAMWESITDRPGKSAVLSYQSLARFARSALIIPPDLGDASDRIINFIIESNNISGKAPCGVAASHLRHPEPHRRGGGRPPARDRQPAAASGMYSSVDLFVIYQAPAGVCKAENKSQT